MPASSYDSDSSEESEEESGESYCSSDDALEQNVNIRRASEDEELEPVRIDDTFNSRMRRIEAWRSAYAKAVGAELGELSVYYLLSPHTCASQRLSLSLPTKFVLRLRTWLT